MDCKYEAYFNSRRTQRHTASFSCADVFSLQRRVEMITLQRGVPRKVDVTGNVWRMRPSVKMALFECYRCQDRGVLRILSERETAVP